MNVKDELRAKARDVEAFLADCLNHRNIPERLRAAMDYSLMAGGKRLRPVLVLVWAELLGLDPEAAMPFAASLELIHTYSLIHDDLPAMDNDDLRRGKPTNHKQFDEATAILAGDGLLTEAFGLMLSAALPPERVVSAAQAVAEAAGARGMVGGQVLDMQYTGKDAVSLEELKTMHSMKTGALITVSCLAGAILAGASAEDLGRADRYGRAIGVSFQIVDDILDVVGDEKTLGKPVGSDQGNDKTTYPKLLGLEESKRQAEKYRDKALECLAPYQGVQADFLRALARYIVDRVQ